MLVRPSLKPYIASVGLDWRFSSFSLRFEEWKYVPSHIIQVYVTSKCKFQKYRASHLHCVFTTPWYEVSSLSWIPSWDHVSIPEAMSQASLFSNVLHSMDWKKHISRLNWAVARLVVRSMKRPGESMKRKTESIVSNAVSHSFVPLYESRNSD